MSDIVLYYSFKQENVDALINCVTKDIGFSHGKPVAALTIYKCLLHWKSFEAERTNVFDRLIQMIGTAIEVKKFILHGHNIVCGVSPFSFIILPLA